ncbi:hypothetical protein QV05_06065 [Gallibacterium genomosp. 1]|uniref:ESPR domain-containing protein n=1 Tax=Gallibacterium genomosp. 1 TaxID=155515 RepID=A0AB36DVZ9_9PAST|nr:hypothetical protein QV05_06065 [Gallibacterium genomosp. 1]
MQVFHILPLVYEKKIIRKKNYPNISKKLGAISFGRRLILLVVAVVLQFQLFANTSSNNKHLIS